MYIHLYTFAVYICICIYVYLYIYICAHIHVYSYAHTPCTHTYARTRARTHTRIRTCIHANRSTRCCESTRPAIRARAAARAGLPFGGKCALVCSTWRQTRVSICAGARQKTTGASSTITFAFRPSGHGAKFSSASCAQTVHPHLCARPPFLPLSIFLFCRMPQSCRCACE